MMPFAGGTKVFVRRRVDEANGLLELAKTLTGIFKSRFGFKMDTVLPKTSGSNKYKTLVLKRVEEASGLLDFARL